MNLRDMYERDRRERLANLAPQRDQKPTSEADVWDGVPHDRDANRIRQIERDRYAEFWRRRFGRTITDAEYPAELQNGGAA